MPRLTRLALSTAIFLVSALASAEAAAKAAYYDLATTVEEAETIAIVHTELVRPADIAGEHWHYRQLVDARVIATLEGPAETRLEIAASKSFICAPVNYEAGTDYLVFLANDNGHLVTVNHEMGALEIEDGMVDWPYDPHYGRRPLADVVHELRTLTGGADPVVDAPAEPAAAPIAVDVPLEAPTPIEAPPAVDAEPAWSTPLAMGAGAFAVVLGMLVATRRRRRR